MVLLRRPTSWAALFRQRSATGPIRNTFSRPTWHRLQRRAYASGGEHGSSTKASSDLPWLIGSIVVTAPTCYYLIQQHPSADHGHDEHGHGHGEEHGEEHEKEGEDEHEEESTESKTEDLENSEETADDSGGESLERSKDADSGDQKQGSSTEESSEESESSSDGGEEHQGTPATSDDEESENKPHEVDGGNNVEGVRFKGATQGGTREGVQGDTRKHIPDAKGYNKRRIESDYGKKQGQVVDEPGPDDEPAASRPPKSQNYTSGKQEGLSNTDTKHSTDLKSRPDTPMKGEGTPETSKSKGTVDPTRPQA